MEFLLSSKNYSLEYIYFKKQNYMCYSCNLLNLILNNNSSILIIKEKNKSSPKWFFYKGNIGKIFNYLCPIVSIDNLIKYSQVFNNFYEIIDFAKQQLMEIDIVMELIKYQQENININYMDEIL
tara:strand:- start:70 stop:441 length:372 start_codon:yes stop_codon:yes gene_type:complete